MPKSTVEKCIKNVYSLRTSQGTISDQLHTVPLLSGQFVGVAVYNSLITPLFIPVFATSFSTSKMSVFNLLYRHLYPQSTAPINKKNKGKMERNT